MAFPSPSRQMPGQHLNYTMTASTLYIVFILTVSLNNQLKMNSGTLCLSFVEAECNLVSELLFTDRTKSSVGNSQTGVKLASPSCKTQLRPVGRCVILTALSVLLTC